MNDRKLHVMLTAQKLFADKGFTSTSIQDIIEEAKISKGTFYNYFVSKNECLMAILERAFEESVIRRGELLIGNDKRDKHILAEQILVRMHVNREFNMLPIFEAVLFSEDEELRNYVKSLSINELKWMSRRLVDVYGIEAEPHAVDCAVIILGMIKQMLHYWTAASIEALDIEKLVHFSIRRVDALMRDMVENKDFLLGNSMLLAISREELPKEELKAKVFSELEVLHKTMVEKQLTNQLELISFIIDELRSDTPRLSILEPIIRTMREGCSDTEHASDVNVVVMLLWKYIDVLKIIH